MEEPTVEFYAEVREENGIRILVVRGEVDLSTSERLKEAVYESLEEGPGNLVVDLNGLDFMDTTGLGALVAGLKRARQGGGDLSLVCNRGHLLKIFSLTGLDKVFSIYDNLQRCLQSLSGEKEA
ncbi:MAG: STAS domain-containing protein [Candidatus Geothermincolales bacterium]